ncbi:MAG TPA: sn-glycerol-3-phosphate ABC transporter ATP-binding protein UgpC [Flavisolibacter sp.]|nr:sn-glycerol-3-phosphate ABC transporter ATP-binding protein UgpC [Flavisolibacter sp.]
MAEVILQNISKIYPETDKDKGRKKAVDDISFTVNDKEFMVLVGPSGCGKSTLLRMIAGLEEISEGSLLIDGNRMNERTPRERDIAMVFQNYALYPHMTVYENMAFGLQLQKISKEEIRQRVMETAQLLEIEDELNKKPKTLSGGQRQRVAIGRAIIRRPKVFLFDEPLSNLDAKLRSQMRIELQRLHREINATMIYVTHDQTEAMTLGHRIAVLSKGKLMQLDTPMNLYDHPANKFVAGFIGSPSMNFLKGRIIKETGLLFEHESKQCRILLEPGIEASLGNYINSEIILGIRPENISLVEGTAHSDCSLEVLAFENMGNEQLIYLSIGSQTIIVRRPQTHEIEIGDKAAIAFSRKNLLFMVERTGQVIETALHPQANSPRS